MFSKWIGLKKTKTFLCFHYEGKKGWGGGGEVTLYCVVLKDGKFSFLGLAAGGKGRWGGTAELSCIQCEERGIHSVVGGLVEVF